MSRLRASSLVVGLLLISMPGVAAAQPCRGPDAEISLRIPRLERPPTLEEAVRASEAGTATGGSLGRMACVTGFIQRAPRDGRPSSETTTAYLGYDAENFYVVFVATDREPDRVRARMVRREAIDDEDQVSVMLDTFRDRRRAYFFAASPHGIQRDSLFTEGDGFSDAFDTVWHTEGRTTARGFVVIMALPFKTLRFTRAAEQSWNLILGREIARKNESSYWPHVSSRITGFLSQAAPIDGIRDVSPGRNLQFVPYATYRAFRTLDPAAPAGPRFVSRSADAGAGVDAKVVLDESMALDVTVNPDFSQVESDEPQVTVNRRFEVFFPEKRPFFLENAHFFDTPIDNLVFTRRIADPQVGVRLTGKAGPYAVGGFVIDDQAPGRRVPAGDRLAGSRALTAVARISRDILDQSSVAFLFTSRDLADSHNRVGGIDGRFRWARNWTFEYQAVGSTTHSLDGETRTGHAVDAELEYVGRQLFYVTEYNDRSPEFGTELGFVPRTDMRRLENSVFYRFRPEGRVLIAWGPQLFTDWLWDYEGLRLDRGIRPGIGGELGGRTFFNVSVDLERERLRPVDFPALTAARDFSHRRLRAFVGSEYLPRLGANLSLFAGDAINFVPPAGRPPGPAREVGGQLMLTVRPTTALRWDTTYIFRRLSRPDAGRRIFDTDIVRSRWNWQITRELSIRAIVQHDSTRVDDRLTSLDRHRNLNADVLVTYLVNPWTALHVGYNGNMRNVALVPSAAGFRLARTDGTIANDGRQVFVKASYLWRP